MAIAYGQAPNYDKITTRVINPIYTIDLFRDAKNNKGVKYDFTSLLNIFTSGIFDNFSIPIYAYRDEIGTLNQMPNPKGTTQVGFVNSFDDIQGTFSVTIFQKFESCINELGVKTLYPRVLIDKTNSKVSKVVQLDICKNSRYK